MAVRNKGRGKNVKSFKVGPFEIGLQQKSTVIGLGTILVLVLYLVGIKFLLLPMLVAVSVWRLPMPQVLNSVLSRIVVIFFVVMGLIQISAALQFFVLPNTGFEIMATILYILFVFVWLFAPKHSSERLKVISSNDAGALVVVAIFLLPFAPILTGQKSIERIADIGSLQASDGIAHYDMINLAMADGHSSYRPGTGYYPSGYEVSVAFMQNTLFNNQYNLGWNGNVLLFFSDFLFYGSLLGYVLCLLCISWLKILRKQLAPEGLGWSKLLAAACIAPTLAILYLLSFISEGFLNYYAICAALVCGVLFLGEIRTQRGSEDSIDLSMNDMNKWWLTGYLILMYVASMSWPLLIPPFLVTVGLYLLPARLEWKKLVTRLFNVPAIPILLLIAFQLVPIFFQLKYSKGGTTQGLNTPGGLFQFHAYILIAGALVVLWVVTVTKIEASLRRVLINVFFPLFIFIGLLTLFQYFTVGAITYYVIKVSLLAELMLLALGAAVFVSSFASSKLFEARTAIFLPFLFLFIILLLISSINNPLKDLRDLLRTHSNDAIPQYLSQDVQAYINLGEAGKLHHMNMTVLHYNPTQDKFFADMQGPSWASAMQYDTEKIGDIRDANCINYIYANQSSGDFSTQGQQELQKNIQKCALFAKQQGNTYYVVTDPMSAPHVRQFVGPNVTYVVY